MAVMLLEVSADLFPSGVVFFPNRALAGRTRPSGRTINRRRISVRRSRLSCPDA